ncbi:MAG: CHC2 zinc finger domain-containing protein, partial [Deltaproteobacteria bacterium]|nr:CHC2 zinc finger domain-containing protein [Deltaproteobacteria bacterium]
MRIPESKIAEIAMAADIVRTISDYVELRKAGKDYRGICPFHGDKDPSFYVSPQKGIFHCFGCAVGGSVFNFIMRIENLSFVEAVKLLAQKTGVPLEFEKGFSTADDPRA